MNAGLINDLKPEVRPADKYYKVFTLIILLLVPLLALRPLFDNDTYTLLNIGKYITARGFPSTDPFTIHEGLSYTIEQWLTAVIFYILYGIMGKAALYIMAIVIYYATGFVIYLTSMKISGGNKAVSTAVTVIPVVFLSLFIVLRPQLFSVLLFILEIYILESYVQSRKNIVLAWLPLISLLLINLQSALWIFFFLLYIPCLLDGFSFKLLMLTGQGYPKKPLVAALLASIVIGAANPYGTTAMTILFKSYGHMGLDYINEIKSPDFKDAIGIFIFALYCLLMVLYLVNRKGTTRTRYILITLGTAYMGLASARNIPLFIVCSYTLLAYYYREMHIETARPPKRSTLKPVNVLLILALIVTTLILKFSNNNQYYYINDNIPVGAVKYIKSSLDADNIRLYNSFNTGAYLEFEGIKTFIDPRAEVFFKSNNKKEDIYNDYTELLSGRLYYRQFIQKYNLTHFLTEKDSFMGVYLGHDPEFKKLYEDSKFILYAKKSE